MSWRADWNGWRSVFVRAPSADRHSQAPRQCDLAHGFNPAFTSTEASPERTHSSQIVLEIEGWVMTKFQYLQEQAARAERLARSILDAVTAERLQAFAAECRAKAKTLDEPQAEAA